MREGGRTGDGRVLARLRAWALKPGAHFPDVSDLRIQPPPSKWTGKGPEVVQMVRIPKLPMLGFILPTVSALADLCMGDKFLGLRVMCVSSLQ